MNDSLQFRMVDAFADTPYTGNPAGVVLDADALSTAQMQTIAREINASETAFVLGANDLHRPTSIRWFTPGAEVRFCGHATLAAAHALFEAARPTSSQPTEPPRVEFDSAAGILGLHCDQTGATRQWWLAAPDPGLRPDTSNPSKLCALLGLTAGDVDTGVPIMRTRDEDVILFVRRWQRLAELHPAYDDLGRWCRKLGIRGICVATLETLTPSVNVHSRFFAPAVGIAEDPVTGSIHGPLATLLVVHELVPMASGRALLSCAQGEPGGRAGVVRTLVESTPTGYRVFVGGQCQTTLAGVLAMPPA